MKPLLSLHAKDVMEKRNIQEAWVYDVLSHPLVSIDIAKDEKHLFGVVYENDKRCLKVVINPINNVVITTYFDRKMQKKGCT